MNSRPQGGSCLKEGRIELVHNRRFYVDDDKGLAEPLNERDENGSPLPVSSTYILQIFNTNYEYSR